MRVNSNVNRGICIQRCVSVGSLIVTNVAGEGVCVCVYSGHMCVCVQWAYENSVLSAQFC